MILLINRNCKRHLLVRKNIFLISEFPKSQACLWSRK